MAISSTLVTDPLTTATTQSLFTFAPGAWAALTATSNINIGANGVQWASGSGNGNGAVRIDTTFPNDQWCQGTFYSVTAGGFFGLSLRGSTAGGGTAYVYYASNTLWVLGKVVSGAYTQLTSGGGTFAAGDTLMFQVVGNVLKVFHNTVLMTSLYDSSIASGAPGLSCDGVISNVLNTWSAGAAVADPLIYPGFIVPAGPSGIPGVAGGFTANTWRTISTNTDPAGAAGPPSNATGLILGWTSVNTLRISTRPSGGTGFATQAPAGTETTAGNMQGVIFTGCRIVAGTPPTAQIDVAINTTGAGFFLTVLGYFGPEAVWFDPPTVINPTGTMTTASPATIQWGTLTPPVPSNAVAVICDIWGVAALLLPANAGAGEITKWVPVGNGARSVLCGYGAGTANFTADNSTVAPTILVRGYLKSGIQWEGTAFDVSPSTTGTVAVPVSSAATTAKADGILYQMRSGSNVALWSAYGPVVSPGFSYINGQSQAGVITPSRLNAAALPLTMGEQAFFVGAVLPTGPVTPSAAKGILSIRSTTQP